MKLEELLAQLPKEQIKRLVARRQLSLVVADPSDLHTLAHYLSRERNFFLAFSGLAPDLSRRLLEIRQQGGRSPVTGKRHLLEPLAAEGLLFLLPLENPQFAIVPDEYLFYLSRIERNQKPARTSAETYDLMECLQVLEDRAIEEMAQRLLPEADREHAARMAAEMKAYFSVRENVEILLKQLSTEAQQLFQHLLDCGGRAPLAAVRAHFGESIGPLFGYYSKRSGEEKLSPLDELEQLGLVFRIGRRDACILVVPYEIFDHFLRDILARKEARRRQLLEQAVHEQVTPVTVEAANERIETELLRLLLAVHSQGLRATQKGAPNRQDLRRILRSLPHEDTDRLLFLLALTVEMAFLRLTLEGAVVTEEAEQWFDHPDPKRVRALFNSWLHMRLWDETRVQTGFAEEPVPQLQQGSLVSSFRYLVRDTLLQLQKDSWISVRTFLYLCRQDPDFDRMAYLLEAALYLQSRLDGKTWPASFRNTTEMSGVYETDADAVLEKMLRTLNYLGLVDLGLDRHGDLLAIRKTATGEAILTGEAPVVPVVSPGEDRLTLQPNLEIIAPTTLPLRLHLTLASFCEVHSVDHVVIYKLSQQTVARAIHANQSLHEFRSLLEESARQPLPQTFALLFDSLQEREGEIELGQAGGFLRVRDPYLLAELKSRQVLDAVVSEQASDTMVLLKPHVDLESLQESLRRKGYFVRLMDGNSKARTT